MLILLPASMVHVYGTHSQIWLLAYRMLHNCGSMWGWSDEGCTDTVPKPLILTLTVLVARPDSRQVMFNCECPLPVLVVSTAFISQLDRVYIILKLILITSKIIIIIIFFYIWNQMKSEEVMHRRQACSRCRIQTGCEGINV